MYRFETWRPLATATHDPLRQPQTLMPVPLISYSRRLTSLAEQDPDRRAITGGDRSITRSELESAATGSPVTFWRGRSGRRHDHRRSRRSALRAERVTPATPDD